MHVVAVTSQTNHEGLTWPEWAYAAGIQEPKYRHAVKSGGAPVWVSHELPGYAYLFVNERRAWRNGEDPTEWRADEGKSRAK